MSKNKESIEIKMCKECLCFNYGADDVCGFCGGISFHDIEDEGDCDD